MDGEAQEYQGVTIEFMAGRTAILTIYDDSNTEKEQVHLHEMDDKEKLHAMMLNKGFQRKSEEEIAQLRQEKRASTLVKNRDMKERIQTRKAMYQQQREQRNNQKRARKEESRREREYLGTPVPQVDQMLKLYGGAAFSLFLMATYTGMRKVSKRRRGAASNRK